MHALGGHNLHFSWVLLPKVLVPVDSTLNLETTLFNMSISALTLILVSYLSSLGLKEIVENHIAVIGGVLIGFLSAIAVYRLTTLQNMYETLFAGFGILPALILIVVFALILLGIFKKIRTKRP